MVDINFSNYVMKIIYVKMKVIKWNQVGRYLGTYLLIDNILACIVSSDTSQPSLCKILNIIL